MRKYIVAILFLGLSCSALAQTELVHPNLRQSTKIAPEYFGPNAFPIPNMLDGTTSDKLRIELAADHFVGFKKDYTSDIFARICIPLWTDRVNLTIWMPIIEFYGNTAESQAYRRLSDSIPRSGHEFGDAYVSTDIRILKQTLKRPDITIRAALKSASGGSFERARYYDCPGYFFDASVAKSIYFEQSPLFEELRFAVSAGFLCWQTDNGRQNDAVMYGAMAKLETKHLTISETFGGYVGWEGDGDQPMSLKTYVGGKLGRFEPYVMYQYGIIDYPFHQIKIGLTCKFDILKPRTKAEKTPNN